MSQPTSVVPVLQLAYATPVDEGDALAETALVKGYRFILITGSFATIAWLSRMCWMQIERGASWKNVLGLLYPNLTALALAYLCVKAFRRRSPWLNSLLWVAFFLWLIAEVPIYTHWVPLGWCVLSFIYSLVSKLPLALFLLCYPLTRGQPTPVWIRRLSFLSIATFGLYCGRWVYINLNVYVLDYYGSPPTIRFHPMQWLDAGMVIAAAILFLLRRKLSRLVICIAAAYYLFYASQDLLFANYPLAGMTLRDYLLNAYFQAVAEFLKKLAAGLPIAMLVWFSFRFSSAERRALSREPDLPQAPALAEQAPNA